MRQGIFRALIFLLFLCPSQLIAGQRTDVLDLAEGAVVLSATSRYNEKWDPLLLIDGTTATGWCSAKGKAYPNHIMIELARTFRLKEFCIDNTDAQESGYPGISAREFKLYASTLSSKDGFQLIYAGEAAKGKRKVFDLETTPEARWIKLEVLSNWGDNQYTEIMELEAYGDQAEEAPDQRPIAGVYDTNYNLLRLEQSGNNIAGCYDWDNGTLSGTTDGRVIRFQWTEDGPQIGTAVMVLTSDGRFLNGLWYEHGKYRGLWFGKRVTDARKPNCKLQTEKDRIGQSLDTVGRVILYGIYFDFDSATLRPESTETLKQVLAAVKSRAPSKFTIQGHTDSQGSDEYNLKLSRQRAQAVANWLVANGADPNQLAAEGHGESRPVADNSKPDGRALNRRVEIVVKK
jgi:outer membrane protein OmpA-like peptidoglycan-associated protein